jgi:hypothetical protein
VVNVNENTGASDSEYAFPKKLYRFFSDKLVKVNKFHKKYPLSISEAVVVITLLRLLLLNGICIFKKNDFFFVLN